MQIYTSRMMNIQNNTVLFTLQMSVILFAMWLELENRVNTNVTCYED